jgi:predicted PurR-regulated permease PerM
MPQSEPQVAPKKGMPRGAKIALILSASAIVLIILVGVIIGVFIANSITAPADVANKYMKALNKGDTSTAWGYLTTRTQNEETRTGFDSKASLLKGSISKWDTTVASIQNDEAKIILNVTGTDGSHHAWDITLIKQGGKWKVDKISRA